jgi:hypothetical protein
MILAVFPSTSSRSNPHTSSHESLTATILKGALPCVTEKNVSIGSGSVTFRLKGMPHGKRTELGNVGAIDEEINHICLVAIAHNGPLRCRWPNKRWGVVFGVCWL